MSLKSKLRRVYSRALDSVAERSPAVAAYGDWLDPDSFVSWGGPMNGQPGRRSMIRQLAAAIPFEAVIETGTFRGTTTQFLWDVTGAPVWSVETNPRYATFARWRFAGIPEVVVHDGDSRSFLSELASRTDVPKQRALFYLDAHWGEDLPLRAELATVLKHWTDPIVIVDDFEVPGDPGYGFDDYGPGKRLDLSYLETEDMAGFTPLFPSLPSAQEQGVRRGCVVIVSAARAEELLAGGIALRGVSDTGQSAG